MSRHVFAVSFAVVILAMGTWLTLAIAASQQQPEERIVEKRSDFSPPVKITLAKTKKGLIKFKEKFLDDDDWFKGLTVGVANGSGKTVTYIGVEVLFRRPQNQAQEPPAVWDLEYGDNPFRYKVGEPIPPVLVKPILPGDTHEINLSDSDFDQVKVFLKDAKYPSGINAIELRVTVIGFSDGTAWSGRMLRRDSNSPGGWSPIEPPGEQPQIKQPQSSARNRTADFLKIGFNDLNEAGTWPFLKVAGVTSRTMQGGCGDTYPSLVHCDPQPEGCQYQIFRLYESLHPTDALAYALAPCKITLGGTTFTCASVDSQHE